jgi:hypothetical protein
VGGDLRKLRFLLGREMYFHPSKIRERPGSGSIYSGCVCV